MEVPYVFNNLSEQAKEDKELAKLINDYWVQFAKTGSPNGNGFAKWPHMIWRVKRIKSWMLKSLKVRMIEKSNLILMDVYMRDTYRSRN